MIGLYAQNQHTQNELCLLLKETGVENYEPSHSYHLIIWLSNKKPPQNTSVLLAKDLTLPLSLPEWHLFLQKHSLPTVCYKNDFFMIETDKRLLTNLKTGKTFALTEKENELLAFLIKAPKHAASRETLLQTVWKYNPEAETHTLESHLYALKQKIGDDAKNLLQFQNGTVTLS